MMDEELEDFLAKKDGPKQIIPSQPKPYMSCNDCNFYSRSMASTGGLKGAPTYHKSCTHEDAWDDDSQLKGNSRSLNTGFGGTPGHKTVTPSWCPFLRKDKE